MSDYWRTYKCEFRYSHSFGAPTATWSLIGRHGGVHAHMRRYNEEETPSGGIELHYRTPPDYMDDQAPTHQDCWLLNGPCWHDGSSLAIESYIDSMDYCCNNPERMWDVLIGVYEEHFGCFSIREMSDE